MANALRLLFYGGLLFALGACTGQTEQALTLNDASSAKPVVDAAKPNEVADLTGWFEGTATHLTITSGKVTSWANLVGGGALAFTPPSGTNGPTTTVWGNGLGLQFQAAQNNSLQSSATSAVLSEKFTLVLVLKATSAGPLLRFAPDPTLETDGASMALTTKGGVTSSHASTSTDKSSLTAEASALGSVTVWALTFGSAGDAAQMQIYVNGFRYSTATAATAGTPLPFSYTNRGLRLGALGGSNADFNVAEILIYKRDLSPRDVYALSKYEGKKWGVSISDDISTEIINDSIDTGPSVVSYETVKSNILLTKGCVSCHSGSSPGGGVLLDTYDNIKNAVNYASQRIAIPGQASSSRLVIASSGAPPTMPKMNQQYGGYLSTDQVAMLTQWINEGLRKDATSAPLPLESSGGGSGGGGSGGGSSSSTPTFSDVYYAVLGMKCVGCHSGSAPSGGVNLSTYANVLAAQNASSQKVINSGFNPNLSRLYQVVSGTGLAGGLPTMPKSGSGVAPLNATDAELIRQWILNGAQP